MTMTESFQRLTAPRMTPAERKAEEEARKAAEARKRPPPKFRPELKLKNLHALIEEIYASKQNYNKICEQSQLPYETMEEHVFTFLNQKYGLKRIIKGWLEGIRQGLVDYARDPDVKCFTYILNNELHEDYLFDYHYTIKRTTNQLLYAMLKLENPKVSDAEVTDLFQERLNDYVTEEEWIFLIQKIYEVPRDQERLVERVSAKIADDKYARQSGCLRILFVLTHAQQPRAAKNGPSNPIPRRSTTMGSDVVLVIDQTNLHHFLPEYADTLLSLLSKGACQSTQASQ